MTIEARPSYTITCDADDCHADAIDEYSSGEYGGLYSLDDTKQAARDAEWVETPDGRWLCELHAGDPATRPEQPFTDPMPLPAPLFDLDAS